LGDQLPGVRATPAGRQFLRAALSIVEQLDALVATRAAGLGERRFVIDFYTRRPVSLLGSLIF